MNFPVGGTELLLRNPVERLESGLVVITNETRGALIKMRPFLFRTALPRELRRFAGREACDGDVARERRLLGDRKIGAAALGLRQLHELGLGARDPFRCAAEVLSRNACKELAAKVASVD